MQLYLTSKQIPDLKDLAWEQRQEIVEAAIYSLPITCKNLLVVGGVMMPLTALAVILCMLLGQWVKYVWLPLAALVLNEVFLNLAVPRIRDLLTDAASGDPENL